MIGSANQLIFGKFSVSGRTEISFPNMSLPEGQYYMGVAIADRFVALYNDILSWSLSQPNFSDQSVQFKLANHSQFMATAGSASLVNNEISTASSSPGLVLHKGPLPAHQGFTTSFSWTPLSCTESSGFNFFLTQTRPTEVTIKSDAVTGLIGTAGLSSLTAVSYASSANEYRAYFK